MLYNTLILPHLNYGILAWGFDCSRLFKLQKKAMRIICCSKFNAHTEPLFKKLNILKVEDLLKLSILKFYFKYQNHQLPNYFSLLPFTRNYNQHHYPTRSQNDVYRPLVKHEFAKKCIRYQLPQIVNNTPENIISKVNTHSLHGFCNYIKIKALETYEETCSLRQCYICNR